MTHGIRAMSRAALIDARWTALERACVATVRACDAELARRELSSLRTASASCGEGALATAKPEPKPHFSLQRIGAQIFNSAGKYFGRSA